VTSPAEITAASLAHNLSCRANCSARLEILDTSLQVLRGNDWNERCSEQVSLDQDLECFR
jgi:hypothetical protein